MPPWIYTVLGRRWFRINEKKRRLWNQSHRFIGAWKCVCFTTAFFLLPSSGRMLLHIQFNASSEIFTFNADIVSAFRECNCIAICSGCFKQSDCFIRSRNPKYFCSSLRNLQSAINRQLLTSFSLYRSSPKQILCIWKILIVGCIASGIIINPFLFRAL